MNINFDSDTFQRLLERANKEGTSIPKLVNKILTSVLINEENNETKKTKAVSSN